FITHAITPSASSYRLFCNHLVTHSFPTRRSSDLCERKFTHSMEGTNPSGQSRRGSSGFPAGLAIARPWLHRDGVPRFRFPDNLRDRKSTRLNSSHVKISYAVFCLKKKTNNQQIRL